MAADEYYLLPIPFQDITSGKDTIKIDLKNSIALRIHLLLVTFLGESRYNKDFGCAIWDRDFENISNIGKWKEWVSKSITDSLNENEKRLRSVKVTVEITSEEQQNEVKALRKRMDVFITGNMAKTNEIFSFTEPIYISPISAD